jgi:hypothetical protein
MKASLAYFQGEFNSLTFEWQTASRCKVTLVDDVNGLQGSFVAEYNTNKVMVDVTADSGMKPTKKGGAPPPPPPPEFPEGEQ